MKKNLIVLTVLALVFNLTIQAQESVSKYYGTWEYECNEAPYGFETGKIVIAKNTNASKATIVFDDGSKNEASSVKIKGGILIIETYIEGSFVKITFKKKESKLIGSVYTDDGTLAIVARKKK